MFPAPPVALRRDSAAACAAAVKRFCGVVAVAGAGVEAGAAGAAAEAGAARGVGAGAEAWAWRCSGIPYRTIQITTPSKC